MHDTLKTNETPKKVERIPRQPYIHPELSKQGSWSHQTGSGRPPGGTDQFIPPIFRE